MYCNNIIYNVYLSLLWVCHVSQFNEAMQKHVVLIIEITFFLISFYLEKKLCTCNLRLWKKKSGWGVGGGVGWRKLKFYLLYKYMYSPPPYIPDSEWSTALVQRICSVCRTLRNSSLVATNQTPLKRSFPHTHPCRLHL